MGLIERLKVALGLAPREESAARGQESTGQDVAVTVEHDPETASEDAVKGTETDESSDQEVDEPTTESAEPTSQETATGAESDGDEETESTEVEDEDEPTESTTETETAETAESTDVQSIDGIGPAYAERLGEAGIETVAELAEADAASVAEESGIAEGRVSTWIERAGE